MFMLDTRFLIVGLLSWLIGTLALRVAGQYLLPTVDAARVVLLFTVSLLVSGWFARCVCRFYRVERRRWPAATAALVLPTLVLDAVSAAFFPSVFPNVASSAAGAFGGWMLCCSAGALLGGCLASDSAP